VSGLLSLLLLLADVPAAPVSLFELQPDQPTAEHAGGKVLAGFVAGFATHELGHLVFDVAFDAHPYFKSVSAGGIPFFAISHDPGLPNWQEYMISSAGLWTQQWTSEWILSRNPDVRHQSAPFRKGLLIFDVGVAAFYAGAAFLQTGPEERDTRGMASSLGIAEPWIGGMLLVPAGLDTYRYYHPRAGWAKWASRASKATLVLLTFTAHGRQGNTAVGSASIRPRLR